ncbi:MAG: hypothetical protein NVSMB45_10020 [Ginsengibacter sp.]
MENKESKNTLLKYAGLATQILVSIGIGVFIGIKMDKWFKFSGPLMVWILPLIIITGVLILVIKDTSKK